LGDVGGGGGVQAELAAGAIRGCGARLELHVSYLAGRKHLPIVALKLAA